MEGTLTLYMEVVKYLLETYVVDKVIAEINTPIILDIKQSLNETPPSTQIYFSWRQFCFVLEYKECESMRISIGGFHE